MEEFTELHKMLRISYEEMIRPLTLEEATKLPQKPNDAYEYFLYVEQMISRCIRALQQIPQFKNLAVNNRFKLLKVRTNCILTMTVFEISRRHFRNEV